MNKVVNTAALAVFSVLLAGAWFLTPTYKAQAANAQKRQSFRFNKRRASR